MRTPTLQSARPPGTTGPCWYTASSGGATSLSPHELQALQHHVDGCRAACGRCFRLRQRLDLVMDVVAARRVTTALVLGLALSAAWLLF